MRLKPADIAVIGFFASNLGVVYARYKLGPVVSTLVILLSECIIIALSIGGYYFAKKAFR
jgi:hypothetical protein